MKARHAAALMLVGWYLITPPLGRPKNATDYVDDSAPYWKWTPVFAFDDLASCQERRDSETQRAEDRLKEPLAGETTLWEMAQTESECIAIDDPRLKIPAGLCDSGLRLLHAPATEDIAHFKLGQSA